MTSRNRGGATLPANTTRAMRAKRYTGVIYVDGTLFTHPDRLMGTADTTRNKVVKQLSDNIRDTFTPDYIARHVITLRVENPNTCQVETIKYQ